MVRVSTRSLVLAIAAVLIVVPVAVWFGTMDSRRTAAEVRRLVGQMNDEFSDETRDAHNRLLALGPEAYGELRRILTSREADSTGWFAAVWKVLPASARAQLPDPGARRALRHNLQQCLANGGPVLSRAMTGAVCAALESGEAAGNEMTLLRNLIWSIPESARAVTTLSNYLAHPENTFFFGSVYADELWSKVPQLAPLLAQWLRNKHTVNDAASGLAHLGTNATFAEPLLVETAESGIASPPVQPSIKVSYGPGVDHLTMRRMVAIKALGKIGCTNPPVIAALNKAAESGKDELCSAAYLAFLELEVPIAEKLSAWADTWNPFEGFPAESYRASETLRSIGKLGRKAVPAVPLLDRIASGAGTNTAARFDHFDRRQADGIRIAAIGSLYQIDSQNAARYLQFLIENFGNWEAMNILRQWQEMRESIVPAVSERLENADTRLRAAFVLHGVAPELDEPRRILQAAMASEHLATKATAVNWLWLLHEDPAEVLGVTRELLKTTDDHTLQAALNLLEKMNGAALAAIPELKPLLKSKHWAVRDRAGRLLHKLSPTEMPPIID